VHADDALGVHRVLRDLPDRQRRRVGRDHRVLADDVLELLDHVALHREVLEDRLDDKVRAAEARVVGRPGHARDHARALSPFDDALARGVRGQLVHRVESAGDRLDVDVAHAHGGAADRGGLRDARTHQPGANDSDVGRRLASRQTLERDLALGEPEQEESDEVARNGARRELAEQARLCLEPCLHAFLETDRDRL
jgi:hypothetical protein